MTIRPTCINHGCDEPVTFTRTNVDGQSGGAFTAHIANDQVSGSTRIVKELLLLKLENAVTRIATSDLSVQLAMQKAA